MIYMGMFVGAGRQGKGFFIQHGSLFGGGVWLCVMGMYVIMGSIFNNRVWVRVVLLCHDACMKAVLSMFVATFVCLRPTYMSQGQIE